MRSSCLLISIICTLSCSPTRNERPGGDAHSNAPSDTLRYTYAREKEISPYRVGDTASIDTTYCAVTYPVFDRKAMNEALLPYILTQGEDNYEDAALSFVKNFDEFVEEFGANRVRLPWYKVLEANVILNTPLFLTLKTWVGEYTGALHADTYTLYTVFDTERMRKVRLKELILLDSAKAVTRIAERYFRKIKNLSDSSSLSEDYFFENDRFELSENFGLMKDKMIIFYNEYEIQPYAEGTTTVEIPYTALWGILNVRGKKYIESIKQ